MSSSSRSSSIHRRRSLALGMMAVLAPLLGVTRAALHDGALRAGAQIDLLSLGWLDLSAQLAFEMAWTTNSIYRGTALRTDAVLLGGHYGRRSGSRSAKPATTALHAGGKAGFNVRPVGVVLRAGVTKTERRNSLDLPFYATLGANYRF